MQTYNVNVKFIKEALEQATKPMTTGELAKTIGINIQTVRNHMPTAIKLGFVRKTEFRIGKAETFEATNKRTSLLPAVALPNNEVMPLRDIFFNWSRNPPNDEFSKDVALVIARLYELVNQFIDAENSIHPQTKVTLLKEVRGKIQSQRDRLKAALMILDSLIQNDNLWEPKGLVKYLMIVDDDITSEQIISALDRYKEAYE
jgi:RecA/RadA recombinase